MITVFNKLEDKIVFSGNESEFIDFVATISRENGDENMSFIGLSDAIEYIEDYCEELTIIED